MMRAVLNARRGLGRALDRIGLSGDRRPVAFALAATVFLFLIGQALRPGFASPQSVQTILTLAFFVGLVAAGQMFVVLVGGIDLSIPWVLNAAAILLVASSLGQDARAPLALALTLAMGILVGLANGVGVAFFNVPPVVMTLGMNGIMEGLTLGVSNGLTCRTCASYAPPFVQALAHQGALPFWLLVLIAVSFVLGATGFGRRIYAIGNNPQASYLAGVNVRWVTVSLYMLSGFFAALAGIVLVGFGGQASLGMGDPYLFQSIAAVVIGGVYILGGRGNYVGVLAGSIVLVALIAVLLAERMPDYGRSILYGVVILAILLVYGREEAET